MWWSVSSVIKVNVDESEVWKGCRCLCLHMVLVVIGIKEKGKPF